MPLKVWSIRHATLPMEITLSDNGVFLGNFPPLPDCVSQGSTYDEAVLNLALAIVSRLQAAKENHEPRIEHTA
jgi:predicted RNase H-like HicB family nuclease